MANTKFHIPESVHTVDVSVINTTCQVSIETSKVFTPQHPGHDYLKVPTYAFLVTHPVLGHNILFDLGLRKDWWNSAPAVRNVLLDGQSHLSVQKDIRDILHDGGFPMTTIDTVVWSHWHIDHIGDMNLFDSKVKLVVGPGFKDHILPPHPTDNESMILQSDIQGRELEELKFSTTGLKIGRFDAIDHFGDGSFYLLNAPGHAIGHIAALARVKSTPDSFILMAGDGCLHGGQLRPSQCMPLCSTGVPHSSLLSADLTPVESVSKSVGVKEEIRNPFYSAANDGVSHDPRDANTTIEYLQDADGRDDVFIVFSHDDTLLEVIEFFPGTANDFLEKGWAEKSKWMFLRDFD